MMDRFCDLSLRNYRLIGRTDIRIGKVIEAGGWMIAKDITEYKMSEPQIILIYRLRR